MSVKSIEDTISATLQLATLLRMNCWKYKIKYGIIIHSFEFLNFVEIIMRIIMRNIKKRTPRLTDVVNKWQPSESSRGSRRDPGSPDQKAPTFSTYGLFLTYLNFPH